LIIELNEHGMKKNFKKSTKGRVIHPEQLFSSVFSKKFNLFYFISMVGMEEQNRFDFSFV